MAKTKIKPDVELRFKNEPNSLSSMKEFETVCQELQSVQTRTTKAVAGIAEKLGVNLSVEIYFSLSPKF